MHSLFPAWPNNAASFGLLCLRLVAGIAMMLHGLAKFQSPGGWMGWMGEAIPGFLQGLAAAAEFGVGLAWVVGLLTPLVSTVLAINMVVALLMVSIPKHLPLVADPGQSSSELAWMYLVIAALLATNGPGRFSLDRLIFQRDYVGDPLTARDGAPNIRL